MRLFHLLMGGEQLQLQVQLLCMSKYFVYLLFSDAELLACLLCLPAGRWTCCFHAFRRHSLTLRNLTMASHLCILLLTWDSRISLSALFYGYVAVCASLSLLKQVKQVFLANTNCPCRNSFHNMVEFSFHFFVQPTLS